jgi:hypothetical protein
MRNREALPWFGVQGEREVVNRKEGAQPLTLGSCIQAMPSRTPELALEERPWKVSIQLITMLAGKTTTRQALGTMPRAGSESALKLPLIHSPDFLFLILDQCSMITCPHPEPRAIEVSIFFYVFYALTLGQ